jgi:ABC-type branched-subunit amino acid transport system substrate-binding protein
LVSLLRQDNYELAHVAPWLQNSELDGDGRTFPIFASQQEQIAQALKSLSALGVPEFGAVYASLQDYARYHKDVENAGQALRIRLKNFPPRADLTQIARELKADSPRILLFVGGTPELAQFLQGITQQDRQRYVIGLADVNLQIMTQMGIGRHTPVIATQVVPLVNSALPIVAQYRDSLARFYDEPPTAHSLAGYIAARYTREILGDVEGALTRQNVLQAFQLRRSVDLSGFRISFNASGRGGTYVTQSMMSADGRVVG